MNVPWLEVLIDNYLDEGGAHLEKLQRIVSRYPVVFHSVGFNLGSVDPLNRQHLMRVRGLCDRHGPAWVSDHLAWTGARGRALHDLLPLPRTWEVVRHVAERLKVVSDILERPVLIENITRYVDVSDNDMDEWEFLAEIAEAADIGILLDINNACANAANGCPETALGFLTLPHGRVQQLHLAGAEEIDGVWIDTHGASVSETVWNAFRAAIEHFGPIPVCIERDQNIPPLSALLAERSHAATILFDSRGASDAP